MTEEETRTSALEFPKTTRQMIEYYQTKASDKEKKAIEKAVKQAAKAIKKSTAKDKDQDKKKKKQGLTFGQPTPEDVANALFTVLSQTRGAKVNNAPQGDKRTRIRGDFDLNDVARKLLSLAR